MAAVTSSPPRSMMSAPYRSISLFLNVRQVLRGLPGLYNCCRMGSQVFLLPRE